MPSRTRVGNFNELSGLDKQQQGLLGQSGSELNSLPKKMEKKSEDLTCLRTEFCWRTFHVKTLILVHSIKDHLHKLEPSNSALDSFYFLYAVYSIFMCFSAEFLDSFRTVESH